MDDELLLGNKSGLSLRAFPLLCAADLRDTSVSLPTCDAFQQSWGSSTPIPIGLFHPTSPRTAMELISQMINAQGSSNTNSQKEHAILLLDNVQDTSATLVPSFGHSSGQESHQKTQELRAKTSGVAVLTAEDIILGNVSENVGGNDEGSAQATFRTNTATLSKGRDEFIHGLLETPGSENDPEFDHLRSLERFEGWEEDAWLDTDHWSESASNEDAASVSDLEERKESQDVLDKTDGHRVADDGEQDFIIRRDPPGSEALTELDHLLPTQNKKRPRSGNETFKVKRFKGPIVSQIFGSGAPSAFSRRL